MARRRQQSKLKSIDNDPVVKAAGITQVGAKKVALIGAIATVLVAIIGGLWTWLARSTSTVENKTLVLKVIDNITDQAVKKAKVSVEGNSGIPPTDSTDSEGIITFPINDVSKELRIRVEAEGYEPFNIRLIPSNNNRVQEIRLTPVKQKSESQVPTSSNPPPTIRKIPSVARLPSNESMVINGRVEDEQGTAIPNARVSVTAVNGIEVFANTNESGYFNLSGKLKIGQPIELRVEKMGYQTMTQGHIVGSHQAIVVMKVQR